MDNSGDWDCTYHYYLDGQRIVETRDGSDLVLTQQVWGLNYIDELVQTGVNQDVGCSVTYPDGPEDAPEVCERFFWILQDANYNVLGSAAATGLLLERYEYDPYGRRTVFSHNWLLADMTDDGAVNVSEMALLGTFGSTNDPADRRDLNGDGAINICDWSMMVGDFRNAGGVPNDALCTHPRGESGRGSHAGSWRYNLLPSGLCDFGHQGLLLDKEFEKIDNRAREYDYILQRMIQTDRDEYVDGLSRYLYVRNAPVTSVDPQGRRRFVLPYSKGRILPALWRIEGQWADVTKDQADAANRRTAQRLFSLRFLWNTDIPGRVSVDYSSLQFDPQRAMWRFVEHCTCVYFSDSGTVNSAFEYEQRSWGLELMAFTATVDVHYVLGPRQPPECPRRYDIEEAELDMNTAATEQSFVEDRWGRQYSMLRRLEALVARGPYLEYQLESDPNLQPLSDEE